MSGAGEEAAAHCTALVRSADFERYAATLFVTPDLRRSLLAVYAFNLEIARIREQISQSLAGEIRLQWWSDLLAGRAHGDAAANPVAAELMQAIDQHAIPRNTFERMIEAHRFDLYDEPLRTNAEFEAYLLGTAAALFEVAARLLGDPGINAEIVRSSGLAFGLVRIVEAMPRHAARGQIFLPLDALEQAGVSREQILGGKPTSHLASFLQSLAGRAREHLHLALGRLLVSDTPARKAFLPLALLERRLRRISLPTYQPFEVRAEPSNLSTLWTLWRAARRDPFKVRS